MPEQFQPENDPREVPQKTIEQLIAEMREDTNRQVEIVKQKELERFRQEAEKMRATGRLSDKEIDKHIEDFKKKLGLG